VSKTPVHPANPEPRTVGSCPNLSVYPPYRPLASSTTAIVSISPSSAMSVTSICANPRPRETTLSSTPPHIDPHPEILALQPTQPAVRKPRVVERWPQPPVLVKNSHVPT